jgi:hypothetical protein
MQPVVCSEAAKPAQLQPDRDATGTACFSQCHWPLCASHAVPRHNVNFQEAQSSSDHMVVILLFSHPQTCLKSVACNGRTCCGATKSCGYGRHTTCCPGSGICQYFPLKKAVGCCNPARACGKVQHLLTAPMQNTAYTAGYMLQYMLSQLHSS